MLGPRSSAVSSVGSACGCAWYLARSEAELGDKNRAALGKMVWRMANGKDGLLDDNVGPSLYAKAQGNPVKIWGFLANGRLEYWVLPEDYSADCMGSLLHCLRKCLDIR